MSLKDFLATLDPKTASRIKSAEETELIKYPLASVGLTHALNGGVGAGRVSLVYGNTSSGKSMLLEQSIAEWQRQGLQCAYADAEGTYDKDFTARMGVDNKELALIHKKSFGAMTDEIIPLISGGNLDILVIDSISDLLPEVFVDEKGNINGFNDMKQIAAHAKSNTIMLNAIHYANVRTAVILISQTTTKFEQSYVKQVPHGGQKIGFAVSNMVKLTSSNAPGQLINDEKPYGNNLLQTPIGRKVEYLVEKNKMGPQSRKGGYDIYFDGPFVGIDTVGEVIDLGLMYGLFEKSGNWLIYGDEKYNGRPQTVKAFRKDEDLLNQFKDELHTIMTGEVNDEQLAEIQA